MVMHNKTKTAAISLTSILFLAILIAPSVHADESAIDVITIDVPSSCSMSATGMDSHTASVNNGQTTSDIGTTNLKVICNDNLGYAIYAIGYTDDTYGKTVLTSYALGSTQDIITSSTVTTGTSSWAMKLAAVSGTYAPTIVTNYASYYAVPQEYTKVAYYTSSTDTGNNAVGSNLTTTYRAYISPTQPAGTYVGQVKYTLVHPNMNDNSNKPAGPLPSSSCPAYSICYAPNAKDIIGSMSSLGAISGSPKAGKTNFIPTTVSVDLIAPNYKREGYGFAGWSADFEATNNSIIFGPNETISVDPQNGGVDFSTKGLILYPVWIAYSGNMQDWNGCSSLTAATYNSTSGRASLSLSSLRALVDTRDGNVYTVAKLVDGKCWMIEDLKLNAEDSRGEENIAKAQSYGTSTTYGNFIGLADSEDSFSNANNANSLYSSNGSTIINIGASDSPAFRMPRYNNNNTNMAENATNSDGLALIDRYKNTGQSDDYRVRWQGYGNYYTWSAAIADTSASYSQNNASATNTSICPKGWHIPIGGEYNVNSNDYYILVKSNIGGVEPNKQQSNYSNRHYYSNSEEDGDLGTLASKNIRSFPNNFVYSGYYNGSYSRYRSLGASLWSSTADSLYSGYSFFVTKNEVYPGVKSETKWNAFTVRCITQ